VEKIDFLTQIFQNSEIGKDGIDEITLIFNYIKGFKSDVSPVELDISLARGLSYYTGAIFEVKVNNVQMGSVCGGGRYDNLTGLFGLDGISGVGISFGVDRIYDVMDELQLFPSEATEGTKVMITNFDSISEIKALEILNKIRKAGIAAEIYPQSAKMKKQFAYADAKKIPFVLAIGEQEIQTERYSLKNMKTGEQKTLTFEEMMNELNVN
jgi:histidyl-tRNA synthetase